MTSALSGLFILLFVAPGFILAKSIDLNAKKSPRLQTLRRIMHAFQEKFLLISLFILLFLMGLRLMADPQVVSNLPVLGGQALIYASLAVVGSILLALPLRIQSSLANQVTALSQVNATESERPEASNSDLRLEKQDRMHPARKLVLLLLTPLKLLSIVIAGAVLAMIVPSSHGLPINLLTDICLKIMLVTVGLGLGFTPLASMKGSFSRKALLLPFLTMLASLASGALGSLFLVPELGKSLAVSAGFGWYSLSGILIADMGNPQLGALAFLANLFRESLALLSIPLLQHWRKTGSAIAAAGATSMDVSLPVLSLYGAGPLLPLAVYHGFILSLAVPILVPIMMGV